MLHAGADTFATAAPEKFFHGSVVPAGLNSSPQNIPEQFTLYKTMY